MCSLCVLKFCVYNFLVKGNKQKSCPLNVGEIDYCTAYNAEIEKNYKVNDAYYKDLFKRLDLSAAFTAYFSSLWYSTLPCYDIQGMSAQKNGDSALLKKCLWKGVQVPN